MNRMLSMILACLTFQAAAQDESPTKETLLRFTAFGFANDGREFVLAAGEKRTEPFAIPDNGFSAPVPVPAGDAALELGTATAGDSPFRGLAAIKLPDDGRRFLVILLPGRGDGLRPVMVRADDPAFRPGQIMILNLAMETLAADLGGEKFKFAPGSRTIFRPQRKDDLANYQVRFYQSKNGKAKLFAANLWPHFDKKRAFVFLHTDPASGSPSYRSIDEFTDWLNG